jgi:hypothetical protein
MDKIGVKRELERTLDELERIAQSEMDAEAAKQAESITQDMIKKLSKQEKFFKRIL